MQIQTFSNMRGIIHGRDPKRIDCEKSGVLKIGNTEINVVQGGDSIMPMLFHGATGDYDATFTDEDGGIYELDKVKVRNGRISPPAPVKVEMMELRCRTDAIEAECKALRESIEFLGKIFDTNSLNFLIG